MSPSDARYASRRSAAEGGIARAWRLPLDLGYTDANLTLPGYYKGENLRVITLHANGTDVEVAAPAQLLDILRHSLARTTLGAR
jgi:hypothetical protein